MKHIIPPKEKFLGFTDDGDAVFVDYGIYEGDLFHASFNLVSPIRSKDYDLEQEYREYWSKEEFDAETYLKFCERFDCTPNELPNRIMESNKINGYGDIRDICDCSLFDEEIEVGDSCDVWFFESIACGQRNPFERSAHVGYPDCDPNLAFDLVSYWKDWHLKSSATNPKGSQLQADLFERLDSLPDKRSDETMELIKAHIQEHAYDSKTQEFKGYMFDKSEQRITVRNVGNEAQEASKQIAREASYVNPVREANITR